MEGKEALFADSIYDGYLRCARLSPDRETLTLYTAIAVDYNESHRVFVCLEGPCEEGAEQLLAKADSKPRLEQGDHVLFESFDYFEVCQVQKAVSRCCLIYSKPWDLDPISEAEISFELAMRLLCLREDDRSPKLLRFLEGCLGMTFGDDGMPTS